MTVSFATDTVTVIRPAWIVERGDEIPDWSSASEHQITGCRVQPMSGEEVLFSGSGGGGAARDAVISRWKLFAPTGADITERDRVRHQGVVYEVDGSIQRWPSPTGTLAHTEAVLQRVEG